MKNNRKGFTLIEMMIVVVIITVLAMMLFKIANGVGDKSKIADTKTRILKLCSAIEQFHAEFGTYPPVRSYQGSQPMEYEHNISNEYYLPPHVAGIITKETAGKDGTESANGRLFTFGLISFLTLRVSGHAEGSWRVTIDSTQWGTFNDKPSNSFIKPRDKLSDINAVKKWAPSIAGLIGGHERTRKLSGSSIGSREYVYTNVFYTVWDAWRRPLHYESKPPYQSYKVWSYGPDGRNNTDDDIRMMN